MPSPRSSAHLTDEQVERRQRSIEALSRTSQPKGPKHKSVNWLAYDGAFIRTAMFASLAVSIGWIVTFLAVLGDAHSLLIDDDTYVSPNAVEESTLTGLLFLAVPLYGVVMAGRVLRDLDDVFAMVALLPLHLIVLPANMMIAIGDNGPMVTLLAAASLLGNLAVLALLWAERQLWVVG